MPVATPLLQLPYPGRPMGKVLHPCQKMRLQLLVRAARHQRAT